jgi:protein-L-isoaspartate(D-aspartate) O-methyltransferase
MSVSYEEERAGMVELQIARRGITEPRILDAFRVVPRESFVPPMMREFAYRDAPLPIGEDQTISQPYVVALMIDALALGENDKVLEVGAGSGYAAALLGRLAREVHTVERHESLAEAARARLAALAVANVHVHHGDGTLGLPEHGPFDAIAVAAGGPEVPRALLEQLAPGGRLVIPVGPDASSQVLLRVKRDASGRFEEEEIADVSFVPLVGEQGWPAGEKATAAVAKSGALEKLVREAAEPIERIESPDLAPLLDRIGDARVVLLGESTHGTSEFYRMRAEITKALVTERGFDFVAVEADWPDAACIDDFVHGRLPSSRSDFAPFSRFPTWMWRNEDVAEFVRWMQIHDADAERKVGFHGLDIYSLFTSIAAVLSYLDEVDPAAADVARARYGTLSPWQKDPAAYGRAVLSGSYESSEDAVLSMLRDMLEKRFEYAKGDDARRFFDAAQNARVVASAERYYRAMYYRSAVSWNLRDQHMFDTLESLLAFYGPESRGVVWEHNSHVGDARATDMAARGELSLGQLCRERFGSRAYLIGFGTDHGTVAAASDWERPMERMRVRPSRADSYEELMHRSGVPAFFLHLRRAAPARGARRAPARAPRARDRRRVPPGERAREPLLPREPAASVRRARLDRRDARGHAARDSHATAGAGAPRDVPVRTLRASLAPPRGRACVA